MMTDPIADMLTRIRNAQKSKKSSLTLPFSKLKKVLADLLVKEGYLISAEETDGQPGKSLVLELKYNGKEGAIREIKRESKPGRRVYCKAEELPVVLNGYGIAILSTPKGLMTNKDAKKMKIGGEIICTVY